MKRLIRSEDNKVLTGVCGGIAEYFSVDPTLVRVIFALITLFSGIFLGIIAYLVSTLIIPSKGNKSIVEAEIVDKKHKD